jgi:hypothetical protein
VWPPSLFPFLFPTLLAGVTLKEGGCGQRGGIRERPMVFHDEVASYRSWSRLKMIADHGVL